MPHIHVGYDENGRYQATIDGSDNLYGGKSPDEALGHAVRELWLGNPGDMVQFRLTMDTVHPEAI